MPRENIGQWNFTSGEVSPYIAGRVDTKVYSNGLRTCENFIVRPQGGASRRLGTRHVKTSWTADKTSLLVPFAYSDVQAYVLQFGDGFIHFYKNGEPLLESTTTEIEDFTLSDNGGLYQVTATADDLPGWGAIASFYAKASNGTSTLSAGTAGRVRVTTSVPHTLRTGAIVFMHETPSTNSINLLPFAVNRISAYAVDLVGTTFVSNVTNAMFSHGLLAGDRFYISGAPLHTSLTEQYHIVKAVLTYDVFTIANVPYAAGAVTGEEVWTIPIEVVTPYTTAELAELRFAQSADVLYIIHPDHPVMKLTRLDDDGDRTDWLLNEAMFKDGPYLPLNDNAPHVDTVTPTNGTRLPDVFLEVSSYSHTAVATITQAAKTIVSVTNNGGQYLITVTGHGWVAGQSVLIAGTGTTADGNRVVTAVVATDTFHIGVAFGTGAVIGTAQLIFTDGTDDDGAHYLEYRSGDQWRLALITSGGIASGTRTIATVQIIDNVLLYLDEDVSLLNRNTVVDVFTRIKRERRIDLAARVSPRNSIQGASVSGNLVAELSNTLSKSDVGKFIRYQTSASPPVPYWALITSIPNTSGTTAVHGNSVSMATASDDGNIVITGEARAATLKSYRGGAAYSLFASTDVDRSVRLGWGGRWSWGVISAYTSASQVALTLHEDVPRDPHNALNLAGSTDGGSVSASTTTGRTYDWRLGAWSETTGYPSCACFHEQRLVFGRTDTEPSAFWGSVTGDYENMAPTELDSTVLDDSAIRFVLVSGQVNAIKWMESGTTLVLGTNGGEWVVGASSLQQEALTQTNITTRQQSRNGSSRIAQPLRVGSAIVFVDRSEQKAQEVTYLFLEDRLEDKELTTVSDHILRQGGTVVQTAFQQNPHSIGWFLLSDGSLAGMTYNADQEIVAWHRHELGGIGAFIESICVVPNADGTSDDLYLLVRRGITPNFTRNIEVMEAAFYPSGSSRLGMQFVDNARVVLTPTGTVPTVITGLTYLTGETLTVLGDGTLITPVSFTAGVLTLTTGYRELVIGLPYTSTLKSLPPEGGSAHGVSQGMKKRMPEMKVRVADSMGMNAGWSSALVAQDFNATNFTQKGESETTLPFYSGIVPLVPKTPYREDVPWTITYALPYPLNVLAVIAVLETGQ